MTDDELAAFQADAKAKQDAWRESRRAYVAEAARIVATMEPWPLRRFNGYRVKPPPGTIEDQAAE